LLLIAGCSNDADASQEIVGTWTPTKKNGLSITFYDNGTFQMEIVWAIIKGTYTVEGNNINALVKAPNKEEPLAMELNDGKLFIEGEKEPFVKSDE
jgi:hypothetical protein